MRNYIKILSLIALVFTGISCEDMLEPTPYSFTAPENFYRSAADAEVALVGVYHTLSAGDIQGQGNANSFRRDLHEMLAGSTDEGVTPANFANNRSGQYFVGSYTSQEIEINFTWFFLYAGIGRANSLIENLPKIPDADFVGNRKLEIEAEAKLLRGFFHMTLSMMHGAIPVYTSTLDDPTKGRQPVDEVYAQIIEDYTFAYQNLLDRGPRTSSANKWNAAGLLVKVHTYLASMKMNGLSDFDFAPNNFDWVDATANYNSAVTISSDIVANSGYILTANYDRLFRESTKSAQAEEVMLAAEGSSDPSQNVIGIFVNYFLPQGNSPILGGGSGWLRPTAELYNRYDVNDFRFTHNVTGNIGGNASLLEVVEIDGVKYFEPRPLPNVNAVIMSVGKFRAKDPSQKSYAPWATGISLPLLRYADVLLLRAEALYFTGDEAGARAVLSEVRQRAVIAPATVDDLNTAYNNTDFVEELLDERSRELCFETWRKIDLARFNKYDEKINALDPTVGAFNQHATLLQQNWRSEKVWFPIPTQQIDLNPNLVQNAGY